MAAGERPKTAPAFRDVSARGLPDWAPALDHIGRDAEEFVDARWGEPGRHVLLVAGAGFDPRASHVPERLAHLLGSRLTIVLIREERPDPDPTLTHRASRNLDALTGRARSLGSILTVETVQVFGVGDAVIGGRMAAQIAARIPLDGVDDVVLDLSALSIGISFPIVAMLLQRAAAVGTNLHAVVLADSAVDSAIRPQPAEAALPIHGFHHGWRLDELEGASKLWLPQLAAGQRELLDRIFREVEPHDICPILPFPAENPRRGDDLIAEYLEEFESAWGVDQRSIIFASENSPLDVCRTVLALESERRPVFEDHGGSVCVLSPVGSKVVALGSLMAALARQFPVLYVEAVGYEVDLSVLDAFSPTGGELVHVWLTGEPYSPATRATP